MSRQDTGCDGCRYCFNDDTLTQCKKCKKWFCINCDCTCWDGPRKEYEIDWDDPIFNTGPLEAF